MGRESNLEHKQPLQRFECQTPGDLIHIVGKRLALSRKVGHRIAG